MQYDIKIYGRGNLERWLKSIGFSNRKHMSKIEVLNKFGECLPNTSLHTREETLNKAC